MAAVEARAGREQKSAWMHRMSPLLWNIPLAPAATAAAKELPASPAAILYSAPSPYSAADRDMELVLPALTAEAAEEELGVRGKMAAPGLRREVVLPVIRTRPTTTAEAAARAALMRSGAVAGAPWEILLLRTREGAQSTPQAAEVREGEYPQRATWAIPAAQAEKVVRTRLEAVGLVGLVEMRQMPARDLPELMGPMVCVGRVAAAVGELPQRPELLAALAAPAVTRAAAVVVAVQPLGLLPLVA